MYLHIKLLTLQNACWIAGCDASFNESQQLFIMVEQSRSNAGADGTSAPDTKHFIGALLAPSVTISNKLKIHGKKINNKILQTD